MLIRQQRSDHLTEKKKKVEKPTFTKKQWLNSRTFSHRKDILNALLKDEQTYTKDQVEKLITDYMKGKVN